jgi:hypothetical protein
VVSGAARFTVGLSLSGGSGIAVVAAMHNNNMKAAILLILVQF